MATYLRTKEACSRHESDLAERDGLWVGRGDERKGKIPFFPTRSQREAGGNLLAAKVVCQMAEGGGKILNSSITRWSTIGWVQTSTKSKGPMGPREEIEEELTNHFKEIMKEDNTDRGQDI